MLQLKRVIENPLRKLQLKFFYISCLGGSQSHQGIPVGLIINKYVKIEKIDRESAEKIAIAFLLYFLLRRLPTNKSTLLVHGVEKNIALKFSLWPPQSWFQNNHTDEGFQKLPFLTTFSWSKSGFTAKNAQKFPFLV